MILILAIKFSGGKFVADDLFIDQPKTPMKTPDFGKDVVCFTELHRHKLVPIKRLAQKADTVIIPMVKPRSCAFSWLRSGHEMNPDFYRMWADVWELREFNPIFLTLDDEDARDAQVEAINKATGLKVFPDWEQLDLRPAEMIDDMLLMEEADRVREVEKMYADELADVYGAAPVENDDEPPEDLTEPPASKTPVKKKPAAKRA